VPLDRGHAIDDFQCQRDPGAVSHLQDEAWKSIESGYGEVFVLPSKDRPGCIDGYYHLAGSSLSRSDVKNRDQKIMRRHGPASVYAVVYVARDDRARKGIGAALLVDAARRARDYLNNWGLILYAKKRGLIAFYESLGFSVGRTVPQQILEEDRIKNLGIVFQDNSKLVEEAYLMYAAYGSLIIFRDQLNSK